MLLRNRALPCDPADVVVADTVKRDTSEVTYGPAAGVRADCRVHGDGYGG